MTFATNYLGLHLTNYLIIIIMIIPQSTVRVYSPVLSTGHFLLAKLLLTKMAETASETGIQGRIVNVSSSIHGWFSGDCLRYLDLMTRKKMFRFAILLTMTHDILSIAYMHACMPHADDHLRSPFGLSEWAPICGLPPRVQAPQDHPPGECTRSPYIDPTLQEMETKEPKAVLRSGSLQAAATTCYVATHPRLAGVSGKYFADCNEASPSSSASSPHEAARLWRASESVTAPRPDRTRFGLEPAFPSDSPDEEM
ncbi:hypothetical protein BHE74_00033550 [Ensete ventricosum]|nr:hypothetical protein BHE74_00033550 [Ensete ventricosum]